MNTIPAAANTTVQANGFKAFMGTPASPLLHGDDPKRSS
jgi:hypothetical protein